MNILRNLRAIFATLAATFAILSTTPVQADWSLWDGCCGHYYGSVEALYWQPVYEPIFVARRSDSNNGLIPGGRDELYLEGKYDAGIRARLGYEVCDWFFDLAYLYLDSKDSEEESRSDFQSLQPLGGRPGLATTLDFVESQASFRYQNVDGRAAYRLCQGGRWDAYLYGNARWVKIDFSNHISGNEEENLYFLNQKCDFNGGGFGLGAGGNWCVWRGFGLTGSVGVMAIIGETSLKDFSRLEQGTILQYVYLTDSEDWNHILPAFDFKLGVDYAFCFGCWKVSAEVGYELDYYFNVLRYASENLISGGSGSESIPLFTTQDVGFAGPYFKLAASF